MKKLLLFIFPLSLLLTLFLFSCAGTMSARELAREYYNLGNAYYELEEYGKAVDFLTKAFELDGDFRKAGFNLALALIKDDQPERAGMILKDLLKADPENQGILEVLAYAFHVQGKDEQAIEVYRQILSEIPEEKNARYNLGILFWEVGEKEDALKQFQKLMEISPEDFENLFNLGKLYLELDRPAEAVSILEQYLQEKPDDTGAYLLLAGAYRTLKQFDRSLEAYSSVLALDENLGEAWYYSAWILLTEIEDPNKGLTALVQALDYGYKDPEKLAALLESPRLLERAAVESLLEERGLLPEKE